MTATRPSLFAKLFRRTPTTTYRRPRPDGRARLGLTALEAREVPATAVLSGGVRTVTGDNTAETLAVVQSGTRITAAGRSFDAAAVVSIAVDGLAGNDRITITSPKPATVHGGPGNDTVNGGTGVDQLYGDAGNDSLVGGAGNDGVYGGDGTDRVYGGAGDDYLDGGAGNDRAYGNDGADVLWGQGGHDSLDGGAGNDQLYGDDFFGTFAGNDTLLGGTGDDYLAGQWGNDRHDGGAGNDTAYGGYGNDTLVGGAGDDFMGGEAGNDHMVGDAGNDTFYGGYGNDGLYGGAGYDWLFGEAGVDDLRGGDDTDYLDGGTEPDFLRGEGGDDNLFGGDGDDTLYGGAGADGLSGGEGDDGLFGGLGGDGADVLIGGPGDDRFLVPAAGGTVRDLDRADARITFNDSPGETRTIRGTTAMFAAGAWDDGLVERVDVALANLHRYVGNTRLLKEAVLGGEMSFLAVGPQTSGYPVGGWNEGNQIAFVDLVHIPVTYLQRTVYHEFGHNWDEWGAGERSENPYVPAFRAVSGWQPHVGGMSTPPPAGYTLSGDGAWEFLTSADGTFARPVDRYGQTNPREDMASTWEAYFVYAYHGGAAGLTAEYLVRNDPKWATLDGLFAGLRT
ncbi:MAG: hypothetical protein K2X87_11905 [Gemmataceae bacterium]|nr:hypothetical protein [Gemmataceae bacterium]